MSLLEETQNNTPTLEQKKASVALRIRNTAKQNYKQICQFQKEGIRTVWENTQGLTPQQVCDATGVDTVKLFNLHGLLTEAVVKIAAADGVAPDILLPTKAFTRNEDGTVTVLDTPYTG